jgi:hypothetical protein
MANYLGVKPESKGEGRSLILYGPPYAGKTASLADPDCKVLLGDMDHNTSPLDDADNVTIFSIDTYENYEEFRESVRRGYFLIDKVKIPLEQFDIIALDSFTRFEELIKKYVLTTFAPNRKRELTTKFGAKSDWQDLQDIEVREARDWQAMTRTHGFCVLWLGHDMNVYGDPNVETRVTRVQLALQGKYASSRIMGAVDGVLYFDKFEKNVPTKEDPKAKTIIRGVYTQQSGNIQSDVRLTIDKRDKLPSFYPNPKWSKILPYLGYRKVEK